MRRIVAGQAIAALRLALAWLKRIGVEPESAPPSLVAGLAFVPPVVAGVIFFRLTALEVLAIAIAAGLLAHLAARLLNLSLEGSPFLPALVGVALVGSGAALPWAAAAGVVAAALELARARFAPAAHLQVGIVAYALVLLLSHGWLAEAAAPNAVAGPVDPVRQYVGNVPGPIFATSMLAVAIGAAWFWYARRLSLLIVLTFLAGASVVLVRQRWPAGYLDSGPLWFAAALVLADRRTLPASTIGRPLVGLLAGLAALGVRTRGVGVEASLVAVAGMQVLTIAVQGLDWVRCHPSETRARLREAVPALGRQSRPRPARP